jgi:hypothetical protein
MIKNIKYINILEIAVTDGVEVDDAILKENVSLKNVLHFIIFCIRYLLFFKNIFVLLDVVVSFESKCFLYKIQLSFSTDSI